jgi:hypothetical protein
MKVITKQMTLELLKEKIITLKVNDGCTEFTLEGIQEIKTKLKLLVEMNNQPTKVIIYIGDFYVKKEMLKELTGILPEAILFVAVICPGFITKYVASIAIKMYDRFYSGDKDELLIKTFTVESKAMDWITSINKLNSNKKAESM